MKDTVRGQRVGLYDNPFYHDNVYGHAIALLRRHSRPGGPAQLHLDIGCGYGRIAEPLVAALGLTYVGVDADEGGLASLRDRSFETHRVWLGDEEETLATLRAAVAGRVVASISMLDTLEHLPEGDAVLAAIRRLAAEHSALFVLSVPNVVHRDVGFRLAFGRWTYTEEGMLDHTHYRLFGPEVLERVLESAGLYAFDSNDVHLAQSDQNFPADHPALARGTELHGYLAHLRDGAAGAADVNQFVRICAPGRPSRTEAFLRPGAEPQRPLLSVVMRTQGRRPHTMVEALTALAGQDDDDFEVIVVGHRLPTNRLKQVERIIEDCPESLRSRCRLLRVEEGNRTRPLNEGFAAAEGRYIIILDDDDLPFGHWVETFRKLHEQSPGRLLRTSVVRQDVATIAVDGRPGLRAVGSPVKAYPSSFDVLEHLRGNQTPPMSVAFPRGVFHDLGFRFDEVLTTTEDWDYIMRAALVVGAVSSPEVTAIYRWWSKDESSRTVHSQEEWRRNHQRILDKMDEGPVLLPAGVLGRIRILLDAWDQSQHLTEKLRVECRERGALEEELRGERRERGALEEELRGERRERAVLQEELRGKRAVLQAEIVSILVSTSWRLTAPMRLLARLAGRPTSDPTRLAYAPTAELAQMVHMLRRSTSWKLSAPLRRLRGG